MSKRFVSMGDPVAFLLGVRVIHILLVKAAWHDILLVTPLMCAGKDLVCIWFDKTMMASGYIVSKRASSFLVNTD